MLRMPGVRCALRPWRVQDAEALVRHANNANVARQLRDRFPHPYTRGAAVAFLQFAMSSARPNNLAIEVDGEAVGGVGFVPGTDVERYSAEVGYWLGESLWGRGIATEAVALLTAHCFESEHLLRCFALPFASNAASIRVLEKAGYTLEGILRSSSVKAGEPRDQAMYARVNPGWHNGERAR